MSLTVPSGSTITKAPDEILVYTFDHDAKLLNTGVTIASSTFPSVTGLTLDNTSILSGSRKTQVRISGGTLATTYTVENHIVTNETPAQTFVRSVNIRIANK